jgi:hypothetical protein
MVVFGSLDPDPPMPRDKGGASRAVHSRGCQSSRRRAENDKPSEFPTFEINVNSTSIFLSSSSRISRRNRSTFKKFYIILIYMEFYSIGHSAVADSKEILDIIQYFSAVYAFLLSHGMPHVTSFIMQILFVID